MNHTKHSVKSYNVDGASATKLHVEGKSQASFMERVGASTSDLIQSSWGRPSPNMATEDLVSFYASASKGESSSNSSHAAAVSAAQANGVTRSDSSTSCSSENRETFRTNLLNGSLRAQENFDQWSMPQVDCPSDRLLTFPDTQNSSKSLAASQIGKAMSKPEEKNANVVQSKDLSIGDGTAVVSLLSSPLSDIDEMPSETWNDDERNPNKFSASQYPSYNKQSPFAQLEPIPTNLQSAAAPESEATGGIHNLNHRKKRQMLLQQSNKPRPQSQDLIPDFSPSDATSIRSKLPEYEEESFVNWLSEPNESTKPWLHILDKYQDEVWGDMLPLVQEAREEMRAAKESEIPETPEPQVGPAVRRLRMMLQHVERSR